MCWGLNLFQDWHQALFTGWRKQQDNKLFHKLVSQLNSVQILSEGQNIALAPIFSVSIHVSMVERINYVNILISMIINNLYFMLGCKIIMRVYIT